MVKALSIDDAVTVEELRKSYNTFSAIEGISFSIRQGEVFGLLGPNGAGKTTTIKILSVLAIEKGLQ
jgi:ABC-2 type transport system ATP-binding protein